MVSVIINKLLFLKPNEKEIQTLCWQQLENTFYSSLL